MARVTTALGIAALATWEVLFRRVDGKAMATLATGWRPTPTDDPPVSSSRAMETMTPRSSFLTGSYAVVLMLLAGCDASSSRSPAARVPGQQRAPLTSGNMASAHTSPTLTLLTSGQALAAGGPSDAAELYREGTATWQATGKLTTPRSNHTATLLVSGKVLVAGGSTSAAWLASAELFDPLLGTWSATGSLAQEREYHTATRLADGRVLIAGGQKDASTFLASCSLFDPAAGTFSTTGSLAAARSNHTATLLSNGRVLVCGGRDGSGSLASCELYDPATQQWSSTGAMTAARRAFTATLLADGRVLAVGGFGAGTLASAELYSPASKTWTSTGSLATARYDHATVALPWNEVVVLGGTNGSVTTASVEAYDPATGTFSVRTALTTARYGHAATLLASGVVLIAGGTGPSKPTISSSSEILTFTAPRSGLWHIAGSMAHTRAGHIATLLANGQVLVAGGPDATAETYDPTTGTWTSAGSMSVPRHNHAAVRLGDGRVLVTGGLGATASDYLATTELYSPSNRTWTATGSMLVPRLEHTATVLGDGRVLVIGGYTAGARVVASAELYDPASGIWSVTGSMAGTRATHTATLLKDGKVLVAGGTEAGAAELYDPATGTFRTVGTLVTTSRFAQGAALLADGRVLLVGGSSAVDYLTSCEIYDPQTELFSQAGSLLHPRAGAGLAVLPNGHVLAAGGAEDMSGGFSYVRDDAEEYDPFTGAWTPAGKLVEGRSGGRAIVLSQGNVLLAGGIYSKGAYPPPRSLASAELYAPCGGAVEPVILSAPATAQPGETITLTGHGFLAAGACAAAGSYFPVVSIDGASAETSFSGPPLYLTKDATASVTLDVPVSAAFTSVAVHYSVQGDMYLTLAHPDGTAISLPSPTRIATWNGKSGAGVWTMTGHSDTFNSSCLLSWSILPKAQVADTMTGFDFSDTTVRAVVPCSATVGARWLRVSVNGRVASVPLTVRLGTGCFCGDRSRCDDGNPCTKMDTCNAALHCAGTAFTCTPGPCEDSNICDGSTCKVVLKPDGTVCDDGNLCTESDTCKAGKCVGTWKACSTPPASTCQGSMSALSYDTPGLCNLATGTCTNSSRTIDCTNCGGCDSGTGQCSTDACCGISCRTPPNTACFSANGKCNSGSCRYTRYAEGISCSDGSDCTAGDACTAGGLCLGTVLVSAGTPCNDAVACTKNDVCNDAGLCAGTAYTCPPPEQCEEQVRCNGQACSTTYKARGATCDDGDPCTIHDACDGAGACKGTAMACNSPPNTACYQTAGTCSGGVCSYTRRPARTACDDGLACTKGDVCNDQATCAGTPVTCSSPPAARCLSSKTSRVYDASGTCNVTSGSCEYASHDLSCTPCGGGTCDSATGLCAADACCGLTCTTPPNAQCYASTGTCLAGVCHYPPKSKGIACDDGDPCTSHDACDDAGHCSGTRYSCTPTTCQTASACDGAGGCTATNKPDQAPCDDGKGTTRDDQCRSGVCSGHTYACPVPGPCEQSVEPDGKGGCTPRLMGDGTSCDDGDACTSGETCADGVCRNGTAVTCDAPGECRFAGTCNPADGTCVYPVAEDGAPCSGGTCVAGSCEQSAAGKEPPAPAVSSCGCTGTTTSAPSIIGLALVGAALGARRRRKS